LTKLVKKAVIIRPWPQVQLPRHGTDSHLRDWCK